MNYISLFEIYKTYYNKANVILGAEYLLGIQETNFVESLFTNKKECKNRILQLLKLREKEGLIPEKLLQFEGQTKTKLGNSEVRGIVDSLVNEQLTLFFEQNPRITEQILEKAVSDAREKGYGETLFNRRRYLPELTATNKMLQAFGERVAKNMPVQGTAADIIKIAMVKVYERLQKENLKARLIMQVHDELIVECPEEEKEKVALILKEEMESATEMKVKLLSDVHTGKTWYDAK